MYAFHSIRLYDLYANERWNTEEKTIEQTLKILNQNDFPLYCDGKKYKAMVSVGHSRLVESIWSEKSSF